VAITKIISNLMKQNDHYNSEGEATRDRTWSAVLSLDWQRPCLYCIYIQVMACKMEIYIAHCKRQIHPLFREGATYQQTRNRLTVIKIWS
jgi:hypothetical protein